MKRHAHEGKSSDTLCIKKIKKDTYINYSYKKNPKKLVDIWQTFKLERGIEGVDDMEML